MEFKKKGLLFVIEGTDGSGKETQIKMLVNRLNDEGYPTKMMGFPRYDTPTGKIIGGPYLGKETICPSWFKEGANNVPWQVASALYGGDRFYAKKEMEEILESGENLILDRYSFSNMGHQGGKIKDSEKRKEVYKKLEWLEFNFFELPKPDLVTLLYMPYEVSTILKSGMKEKKDGHENDPEHMKNAEGAYLQLQKINNWPKIDCAPDGTINSLKYPKKIHEELYPIIKNKVLFN